jgi:hypothetical protein
MKLIIGMFFIVALSGCASSGYKSFYKPILDVNNLNEVELLSPNEDPKVLTSNDLKKDIYTLRSKNYIAIGSSSFNGGKESIENAVDQAKEIGATVVLASSNYTNTQTTASTLLLPNNKTTYHNGLASSNSTYSNSYGKKIGSSSSSGSYIGTSTEYGAQAVPFTSNQRRYNQSAVFFVKSTIKPRFGLATTDIPQALRVKIKINTGSMIDVVLEDTPAFYANLLPGDVIISINGINVKNPGHGIEIMNSTPREQKISQFKIIRDQEEKDVAINLEGL